MAIKMSSERSAAFESHQNSCGCELWAWQQHLLSKLEKYGSFLTAFLTATHLCSHGMGDVRSNIFILVTRMMTNAVEAQKLVYLQHYDKCKSSSISD